MVVLDWLRVVKGLASLAVILDASCGRTLSSSAQRSARRGSAELRLCWVYCVGSRAGHPLVPSWVPLPVLRAV